MIVFENYFPCDRADSCYAKKARTPARLRYRYDMWRFRRFCKDLGHDFSQVKNLTVTDLGLQLGNKGWAYTTFFKFG